MRKLEFCFGVRRGEGSSEHDTECSGSMKCELFYWARKFLTSLEEFNFIDTLNISYKHHLTDV
jgi:hypothetical protein